MDADLLHLVRANADGMLVLDQDGEIRHANPAAARLLGTDAEDLLGQPFGIPLAPAGGDGGSGGVEIAIRRPRHPDHPEGTAELRCSACAWHGQPATLVSLRDVTEHKRMVAELKENQRRLRRLSAALQQTQMAERLRVSERVEEAVERPIRRARAEARAAARRAADPQAQAAAARIVESLDEALRASARAREELFPPELDGGGLPAALDWLAGRCRENHGLRVRVRVEPGFEEPEDPRLRRFLFLAAQELLQNVARHASTPDAEVSLSGDDGRVVLEVRDRGVGYATTGPRDPERLARRPLRGLGLFNLQQTVLHRGGDLRIHSGPGEGTRVRLSVPGDAMAGDAEAAWPPPAAAAGPGRP